MTLVKRNRGLDMYESDKMPAPGGEKEPGTAALQRGVHCSWAPPRNNSQRELATYARPGGFILAPRRRRRRRGFVAESLYVP